MSADSPRCIGLWLELERGKSETCSVTHIGKVDEPHIVLFFFFFVNICTVMFFQKLDKDWTVSVSFGLCQTHLRYTKAHSILGDQIAYTVGHGAPGTFELMNYHLLHVKCHCTFMSLEQDEFSISAARLSQIFSQWQDNVIFLPKSIGSENQNLLYPKIPLAR